MTSDQIKDLLKCKERTAIEFKEAKTALPDPFYLEGTQRISLWDKIFREIAANILVHREYTDARPATFIIYRDRVETSNPARAHGHGPILPSRFTPFPKNPTLSKFFMQMGRGEELGSGVLNVNRYLPLYARGAKPKFLEGDQFITIIPLPPEDREKMSEKTREKTSEKIIAVIRKNPLITTAELASLTSLTLKGIEWNLKQLKNAGIIRRIGPDKGGHWKIIKK